MDPDPATSSVWTGCFGPSRASPHAGEGKHARSNSKTSLSLSRWWNTSTPQTDNTEALDGDAALFAEQDSMLAQLANDLLGLEGPAPKATAPPAAPAHERKLSWPFSSRKVLPESKPDVGRAADDASVDLHSLDSGEMGGSPSSTAGEAHAHAHAHAQHADAVEGEEQAEGAAPESAEASPARPQGYRRLWQSITSMRKGDRIASPNAAVQTQEYTIESLSRSVLSLKASQTVMEATKLASGLHALDSRAVAALLKELAKAGAPNRASELFDYLRSLPETDELSSLADLYTYTTVIAQCGSHQHLR